MLDQISVVIITRNAEQTLRATLESAQAFSEVVVFDNGSTDDTVALARSFANVAVPEGEFVGFGPTKNHAVALATHDWVLSLDADEVVSAELAQSLATWSPESEYVVGEIRRDNYLMGEHVRRGGWGADWLIRLFHRKHHGFNDNPVHEFVPTQARTQLTRMADPIQHNAIQHLGQFLPKIDKYSEIRRETSSKTYPPAVIFLKSLFAFVRSYFIRGGVLAGWRGLVIAWNEANGVFFKYMKVYADRAER